MISSVVCPAGLGRMTDAASHAGLVIPGISAAGVTQLLITSIVIITVPGPSVMFLIGQALGAGRWRALTSVAGNSLGMALTGMVMVLGVGSLLSRSPVALDVLRIGGGLLLVGIGVHYLLLGVQHSDDTQDALGHSVSRRAVLWSSVGVGVTNPKGFIMFGVVVPSFLTPTDPGQSAVPALCVLSSIPLLVGLICDSLWVLVAALARTWFASSECRMLWLARTGGALIVALGVLVVLGV